MTPGGSSPRAVPRWSPSNGWPRSARANLFDPDLSLLFGGGGSLPITGESSLTAPSFRLALTLRYAPVAP